MTAITVTLSMFIFMYHWVLLITLKFQTKFLLMPWCTILIHLFFCHKIDFIKTDRQTLGPFF